MDRQFVAKELLAVARDLMAAKGEKMADFGDVPSYHNVFDYFNTDGRRLTLDEIRLCAGILEGALSQSRKQCSTLVKKSILSNRADMKTLDELDIKVR